MAIILTDQELINAKRDIDDIGKAVNKKEVVHPRYGDSFKSLPMIVDEFQISSDAAEAAAITAVESANIAQSSSQIAQDSAALAELAATAANISGKVYNTPGAGVDPVTGVADGAYFNVRSSSDESYIDEYQNVGGSAVATGKSYPGSALVEGVKNNTAYFYPTVAQMIAATNLADGMIVATKGYHNIFDEGGAVYLISSTATNYSIPLENGLHAVFRDTFDIRKFGIVSSKTLDQTDELTRMVAYADTRVYEIDFHNYSIMTPKKLHFITGRLAEIRGLLFSKVKHIKNAVFYNDKTEQLVSGTCPIHFMPFVNGTGEFRLTNIKFDVYVSDYRLISGEMDGYLCGMEVGSHRFTDGTTRTIETGYDLVFDGIEFLTPAVSYNLACAGIFTRNLTCNDLKGDYWGIYVVHHTKNLYANDVVGVFRDDLHTPSGRLLVTNLIHEEAEIGSLGAVTRGDIELTSCECYKKTTGLPHTVYKAHSIGSVTINKYQASNCIGRHEFYGGATTEQREKLYIKSFLVADCDTATIALTAKMGNATVRNANKLGGGLLLFASIDTLTLEDVGEFGALAYEGANGSCGELNIINSYPTGSTNGILRTTITVETINIINCELNTPKWVECIFTTLNIKNSTLRPTSATNNPIFNRSTAKSTINLVDTRLIKNVGGGIFLLSAQTDVSLDSVEIRGVSNVFPSQVAIIKKQDVTGRFTTPVAERSIAPETVYTFTIPVKGYVVGSPVVVAFNVATALDFKAGIYTDDTLTVMIKNNTAEAIILPSGSVSVAVY